MAHFAEIGLNNTVQRVIVVNNNELLDANSIEQESKGIEFCRNLFGGTWIQTSFNGSFRKNFAGTGYTYNAELDAFVPPRQYNSWTLEENSAQWQPPVPYPTDGQKYEWDESTVSWQLRDN